MTETSQGYSDKILAGLFKLGIENGGLVTAGTVELLAILAPKDMWIVLLRIQKIGCRRKTSVSGDLCAKPSCTS